MAAAGESIFVLVKDEDVDSFSVPGYIAIKPNTKNKRPIETIILSDSEEFTARLHASTSAEAQEKRRKSAAEAAERKRVKDGETYSAVQEVFNNYPGLYTFYQKGRFERSFEQKVLCKACNYPVHFNDLGPHSELPIHKSYYRSPDPMSYSKPPDVQSIMDNNKGIFSNIVSTRKTPSADCEMSVYCNPCQKKINKKHLLRHLGVEDHLNATIRYMTCEADFSAVAETLTDKTFSIYGNDLFCNPCRVTLPDTLRSLRSHIKDARHVEAKQKHDVSRILADFGNVISLKGKAKQKSLWCNKCDVGIIDGYENVVKHIEGSTHTGRLAPLKERYIGDEEFNQDLAEMFAENKISFQKIKTMRNFLEKYTNRVMPDAAVLRQAIVNEKKKVKTAKVDETEAKADANENSEDEDGREMTVYKEVFQEEEDIEEEDGEDGGGGFQMKGEEVVATEEIEVEVVQFPAVTEID